MNLKRPTPAAAYEAAAEIPSNPSHNATFMDIVERRFPRRSLLRGAIGGLLTSPILFGGNAEACDGTGMLETSELTRATKETNEFGDSRFSFTELPHGVDDQHHLAPGHDAMVLLRWGDPILSGAPASVRQSFLWLR